jgi:molybdopterin synthase sulfur carrier subunit
MTITLKYFGQIAEVTQKKEEVVALDETTNSITLLQSKLETLYPELKNTHYTFAVNQTMATANTTIRNQDEIALLPPFAGG